MKVTLVFLLIWVGSWIDSLVQAIIGNKSFPWAMVVLLGVFALVWLIEGTYVAGKKAGKQESKK